MLEYSSETYERNNFKSGFMSLFLVKFHKNVDGKSSTRQIHMKKERVFIQF